jgi:asparagine synthase (glutamine-hydrolysing)
MCGIAGIVRYDQPGHASEEPVKQLLKALRHRGPDSGACHIGSHAALVTTRLALLDEHGGVQPMTSADNRYTITYNGEIYNWRELREQLKGRWGFRTQSDTEVVLAACATWGMEAVKHFNGMFAFFLWDEKEKKGFAVRDRLGVKPFAYEFERGVLRFASEAKALASTRTFRSAVNTEAVLEYLVAPFFSGVSDSMFVGIHYLQPGCCLSVDRTGIEVGQWWKEEICDLSLDTESLESEMRQALVEAVRCASDTSYPVGTFLSGGLDSTLVSALAMRRANQPIRAYTIHFAGQEAYDYEQSLIVKSDDTPHAKEAARELGLQHEVVEVQRTRLIKDIRAVSIINDALPAWEQELAQYHLARAASAHCKAVLVGEAADETHFGYAFLLDAQATHNPGGIIRRFGAAPVRHDLVANPEEYFSRRYRELASRAGFDWESSIGRLLATSYLIVKRWLPRLLHNGDIHTMAFSVEARVPFADVKLLDVAKRVHPQIAINEAGEKMVLRRVAKGLMPEASRVRRKSSLPKDQSTSHVMQTAVREALDESAAFLGAFLDLGEMRKLVQAARPLVEHERAILFRVLALHFWSQAYEVRA